jgi:hypothetical protein
VRQLHDVYQADVPLTPLYSPNIIAMQVGKLGQLLLRQAELCPKLAHTLAESDSWVGSGHRAIIGTMTTMSLHTMSVIASAQLQFEVP